MRLPLQPDQENIAVMGPGADTGFFRGGSRKLVCAKNVVPPLAALRNNLCFCKFASEARRIFWPLPPEKILGPEPDLIFNKNQLLR